MVSDHRYHVVLPHVRNETYVHLDGNLVREQSLCLRSRVTARYPVDVEGWLEKILLQRFNTMAVADEPVNLHLLSYSGIVEGLLQLREELAVFLVGDLSVAVEVLNGDLVAVRTCHCGKRLYHPPDGAVNPGLVASMDPKLLGTSSPGRSVELEFEEYDPLDAEIHYHFSGSVL